MIAAGRPHRLRQDDVRGQFVAAAFQKLQRAARVRRVDAAGEKPARLHHLVPGVVHRRGGVIDAAHERKLVRDLRHAAGRSRVIWMSGLFVLIGLNGPRISRGASGFMSKVSIWLGAPRLKIMMQALSLAPLGIAPRRLRGQQFREGKPERAERADLEEIATGHAVASGDGTGAGDIEHGGRRGDANAKQGSGGIQAGG